MRNLDTSPKTAGVPDAASERVRHIRETASLDDDTAWVVVSATPTVSTTPAVPTTPGFEPGRLIEFVRAEVVAWPAPIPLASEPPLILDDRIVFAPARRSDAAGGRYRAEFHADGSAVVAIAVGSHEARGEGADVWAIGEGAFVWITIAALRLAAAYAASVAIVDELCVEVTITSPHDGATAPLEIWNRDGRGNGPVGRPCATVTPAGRTLSSSACLTADLTVMAHPVIRDVLHQFGLPGDRHVDPSGSLRRARFVGFDHRILSWAEAIGIPSQP